jgi:hypothetical protein
VCCGRSVGIVRSRTKGHGHGVCLFVGLGLRGAASNLLHLILLSILKNTSQTIRRFGHVGEGVTGFPPNMCCLYVHLPDVDLSEEESYFGICRALICLYLHSGGMKLS